MGKELELAIADEVLYCLKCRNVKVQAGPRWILFCPVCNDVEDGERMPTQVMSCTHCDKPLVVKQMEDGRVYGRCHTPDCGDCFSMQDLCLINISYQRPKMRKTKQTSDTIQKLFEEIDKYENFDRLILDGGKLRQRSRGIHSDDKEHMKVLTHILKKLSDLGGTTKMLEGSRRTLLRHLAWTWCSKPIT